MNSINHEDFFIYVPTLNDVETLAHQNTPQCGGSVAKGTNDSASTALKNWVKISLDGPFVVYARLQNEREETNKKKRPFELEPLPPGKTARPA